MHKLHCSLLIRFCLSDRPHVVSVKETVAEGEGGTFERFMCNIVCSTHGKHPSLAALAWPATAGGGCPVHITAYRNMSCSWRTLQVFNQTRAPLQTSTRQAMLGGLHVNSFGLACAKHGQLTHIWDVHANRCPIPARTKRDVTSHSTPATLAQLPSLFSSHKKHVICTPHVTEQCSMVTTHTLQWTLLTSVQL